MPAPRAILLASTLAATVAAALIDWPAGEHRTATAAVPATRPTPTGAAAVPPASPAQAASAVKEAVTAKEAPAAPRFGAPAADLFATRNWQPPPPPPPKEIPRAPPLPFHYLGKVIEGGEVVVFLGEGARTHLLRKGEVVANYRVEDITQTGMTFVYLPLNEQQQMTFGSAN